MHSGDLRHRKSKKEDTCVHRANSLCSTAETNTTLESNYIPINKIKNKKKTTTPKKCSRNTHFWIEGQRVHVRHLGLEGRYGRSEWFGKCGVLRINFTYFTIYWSKPQEVVGTCVMLQFLLFDLFYQHRCSPQWLCVRQPCPRRQCATEPPFPSSQAWVIAESSGKLTTCTLKAYERQWTEQTAEKCLFIFTVEMEVVKAKWNFHLFYTHTHKHVYTHTI